MQRNHSFIQNLQYFFVCLFFASLNFEVFSPFVPNFSVAKMAALLYIVVSFFSIKDLFLLKDIKTPMLSVFFMFFLMMFSSIIHVQINRSIFDSTLFLNIVMLWLLLNHQRRDERVFNEGMLWFSISSFAVALFYQFDIGVTVDDDMRVVVFGENANGLGLKMGVGTLYLLSFCLCHSPEKQIHRPWLLLMVVPMVSLLFATASRVSVLVLGSGLLLFVIFRPSMKRRWKIISLLIGIIVLYWGYQIVLDQEVLMTRMGRTINEGSVSGRDYIWEKYMKLIEDNPILGVGFTGAEQYSKEVFGHQLSPHNVLIEVALYSGVLGLACFVLYLLCAFRDAWLFKKRMYRLGPLITNMVIIGMVFSGQALGVKLFWVLTAFSLSYRVTVNSSVIRRSN